MPTPCHHASGDRKKYTVSASHLLGDPPHVGCTHRLHIVDELLQGRTRPLMMPISREPITRPGLSWLDNRALTMPFFRLFQLGAGHVALGHRINLLPNNAQRLFVLFHRDACGHDENAFSRFQL